MIWDSRPKRGWNKFEPLKSWYMTQSILGTQSWICFQFLVKKTKRLSRKQSKLKFWNRLHLKIALLCRCWHKQPLDDQTIPFCILYYQYLVLFIFCMFFFFCIWYFFLYFILSVKFKKQRCLEYDSFNNLIG